MQQVPSTYNFCCFTLGVVMTKIKIVPVDIASATVGAQVNI